MSSPLFTPEQWQAIVSLFESRLNRPGASHNFPLSVQLARNAISQFDRYFETLSPQLTGADKAALFTIKNDFTDVRHATYQAAARMEVRYRKFKLQPTTTLIEHLNARSDEQTFKELVEQALAVQNKLTDFHSIYFWCEINRWGIISCIVGGALIILSRVIAHLFPETGLSTFILTIGICLVLGGLTAVGLVKFQEQGRDPTTTMRYLEEIHKHIDKLRFQFDDLKAIIAEDTPHEQMQKELDVIIDSIKELKLLCFP